MDWFVLRLTMKSDNLVPDEITRLIGCEPDDSWQKGKPIFRKNGTLKRIPKFGHWSVELRPKETDEWDCGEAMMELLRRLPSDIHLWKRLTAWYEVSVKFALVMTSTNKGFVLLPKLLKYLGDRGIGADFDVDYDDGVEPSDVPNPDTTPRRRSS